MNMSANARKDRKITILAILVGLAVATGLTLYATNSAAQQRANSQTRSSAASGRSAARRRGGFAFHEPAPRNFNDHKGYTSLFDGKDLKGWDGDPTVWSVKDGMITGISNKAHPKHSYLVYRGLKAKNFDLKVEIKVTGGGGSGIQYRSQTGLPWLGGGKPPVGNMNWWMTGPQADFWFPVNPMAAQFTGQFYSENTPLRIIAWRGEVVQMAPGGGAPTLIGTIGNRTALGGYQSVDGWNQYLVVARNGTFLHILNGQLMAVLVDDNPNDSNNHSGYIGLEIEGAPCEVQVRSIWIRQVSY